MFGCAVTGSPGPPLMELNRAPHRHPNQTAEAVARAVLELREAHMRWGPRKLKQILQAAPAGPGDSGDQHHRRDPARAPG